MGFKSFLSKFGHDVKVVLGVAGQVEKAAEPFIEMAFPASIPAFGLFDRVFTLITSGEAAFAAVGQASNGPAKLDAILSAVETELDGWVSANLPGAAEILKSEQYLAGKRDAATGYVNSVVKFLNTLPAGTQTVTTPSAVAAAAAAAAAIKAAGVSPTPTS